MTSDKWQPIDTAPTDDSLVLLYSPTYGRVTGRWMEASKKWCVCVDNWTMGEGLYVTAARSGIYVEAEFITDPTRWMPMPGVPE